MRIGSAVDHGGFELKKPILDTLHILGHEVVDFGAYSLAPEDDYPDFVVPLAQAVGNGEVERGIAVCGSGVGACVAANKVPEGTGSPDNRCLLCPPGRGTRRHERDLSGGESDWLRAGSGLDPRFPGCPIHRGRATSTSPGKSRGDREQRGEPR